MSNLNPQQFPSLYHGTIETLKPGDLIKPRYSGAKAWATPSFEDAEKHAKDRISSGLGFESEGKHPHHGNIYEVEPVSPTLHSDASSQDFPGARSSNVGFVVKNHIASVLNPYIEARSGRDPYTNSAYHRGI
jgi:hypothetical protein